MAQLNNYVSLFQVYDNPKEIIEKVINTYFNNYKSSTYYLNDLTRSFKFTEGIHQRSSDQGDITEFRESIERDLNDVLGNYFDTDSISRS